MKNKNINENNNKKNIINNDITLELFFLFKKRNIVII